MNLPNSSKIFKHICFPLIFLFVIIASHPLNSTTDEYRGCIVRDGRVYIHDSQAFREFIIPGYTHGAVIREKIVYYLRAESVNSPVLYAGYRNIAGDVAVDRKVPREFEGIQIKKIDAGTSAVFFLSTESNQSADSGGMLYSFDFNSLEMSLRKNVHDFIILNNVLLAIRKKEGRYYLESAGDELPLSVEGTPGFSDVIAGGVAVISGGGDREIVDTVRMKSVYLYSENRRYMLPEEYNLEIRAVDEGNAGQKMVFYKIDIDGSAKGRTKTALSQLPLVFREKIEENSYHIITLERWELNNAHKQYMRVNNIHQPDSMKVYIPENRVMILNVIFNGKKYSVRQSFAEE